jgi:hypothetical protein
VPGAHHAIGTGALGVFANALFSLRAHAGSHFVKWPCALVFAASGVAGAAAGSTLGKAVDAGVLMIAFAAAMALVGLSMLRGRSSVAQEEPVLTPVIALRLAVAGVVAGGASGFFGIGGGFLIVPGLMLAAGMPMINAVASSLVSVSVFAGTTAANYAVSGYVLWDVAICMIAGGAAGALIGARLARRLSRHRETLQRIFGGTVIVVAILVGGMETWRALS